MHAMKSISEAGRDTPRSKDPSRTESVSERVRKQHYSSKSAGTPGTADLPSVTSLRSGWLLLTGLGLVSLFYAAILIYHVSVPPSEAHAEAFMERARRLCIRYRLVSSLNPEQAIQSNSTPESQNNVASTGVSEDQIAAGTQAGR